MSTVDVLSGVCCLPPAIVRDAPILSCLGRVSCVQADRFDIVHERPERPMGHSAQPRLDARQRRSVAASRRTYANFDRLVRDVTSADRMRTSVANCRRRADGAVVERQSVQFGQWWRGNERERSASVLARLLDGPIPWLCLKSNIKSKTGAHRTSSFRRTQRFQVETMRIIIFSVVVTALIVGVNFNKSNGDVFFEAKDDAERGVEADGRRRARHLHESRERPHVSALLGMLAVSGRAVCSLRQCCVSSSVCAHGVVLLCSFAFVRRSVAALLVL